MIDLMELVCNSLLGVVPLNKKSCNLFYLKLWFLSPNFNIGKVVKYLAYNQG